MRSHFPERRYFWPLLYAALWAVAIFDFYLEFNMKKASGFDNQYDASFQIWSDKPFSLAGATFRFTVLGLLSFMETC